MSTDGITTPIKGNYLILCLIIVLLVGFEAGFLYSNLNSKLPNPAEDESIVVSEGDEINVDKKQARSIPANLSTAISKAGFQTSPKSVRKHIFVFGLESSGTRFLARALFQGLKQQLLRRPNPNLHWDGEAPPCFSIRPTKWPFNISDLVRIYHFSLPYGLTCESPAKVIALSERQTCDSLHIRKQNRFFTNITKQILQIPDSVAVISLRDFHISLESKRASGHCQNITVATNEHRKGLTIIKEAALKLPDRVYFVSYEELDYIPEYIFAGLWKFLHYNSSYLPRFANQNFKYIKAITKKSKNSVFRTAMLFGKH